VENKYLKSIMALPLMLAAAVAAPEEAKAQSQIAYMYCFNTDAGGIWQPCTSGNALIGQSAPYTYNALGCSALPALTAATGFSVVPSGATFVTISVSGANVRYRDDGVAPTAASGILILAATAPFSYSGPLGGVQFIGAAAGASGFACFYQ
jgi:hypothetical protein